MKLIHCADLHLGSRMESGLPPAKAQERRMELLHTFVNMVERASSEGVEAMLLCGDLFDTEQVSVRTKECGEKYDRGTPGDHVLLFARKS